MDKALIQQIASDIAKQTFIESGVYYLAAVAITILVAYIFTFIKQSAKHKSHYDALESNLEKSIKKQYQIQESVKYDAIKENLDALKLQVEHSTQVSESIKADIAYKDWAKKEDISLKREKIEMLYLLSNSFSDYLEAFLDYATYGGTLEDDPFEKAEMIVNLYLSNLKDDYSEVYHVFLELKGLAISKRQQAIELQSTRQSLSGEEYTSKILDEKFKYEYRELTLKIFNTNSSFKNQLIEESKKINDFSSQNA